MSCVAFIYSIVVYGLLTPPALMRFAKPTNCRLSSALARTGGVVTANLGSYLVMLLVIVGASLVAQIVGTIACVIGLIFTTFWMYLVAPT